MDIKSQLSQEVVEQLKQTPKTIITPDGVRVTRFTTDNPKPKPGPQGRGWHRELSRISIFEVTK